MSPIELFDYITKQLDVAINAKEFVLLWAVTGGILRYLHFLMTKTGCFSGSPIVFNRSALINYLKTMADQMMHILRPSEWKALVALTNKNTKGKTLGLPERETLESLFAKGLLSRLGEKIERQWTMVDVEKSRYMVSSTFVRSVVRYRCQAEKALPDVIAGDVAGFALEDLTARLIDDAKRTERACAINGRDLTSYDVENLYFDDCDVDLVLRRGAESLTLCVVSQKYGQPFLEKANGVTSIFGFCSKNVTYLLEKKIGEGCTVAACTVVAMTADQEFKNEQAVEAAGEEGLVYLRDSFPAIDFSFETWRLDDMLPLRHQPPLRGPSADDFLSNWPTAERPEFESAVHAQLESKFPTLIRGLPGVGKSVSVERAAKAAAKSSNVPLYIFDLLDSY